jgi:fucose permease
MSSSRSRSGGISSLDGWLSSYAARNPSVRGLWAALPSVFWTGILTGRLLAAFALQRLAPGGLLSACLVVAFGGVCLLLAAPYGWVILVAAALNGFAMASRSNCR